MTTELRGVPGVQGTDAVVMAQPLTRIVESASVGIISALDETSVEIVTEWLEGGSPGYVEFVNAQWRVRRDSGAK